MKENNDDLFMSLSSEGETQNVNYNEADSGESLSREVFIVSNKTKLESPNGLYPC